MILSVGSDTDLCNMDDFERCVTIGLHRLDCMHDDGPHTSFSLLELRAAIRKSTGMDLSYKQDSAIKGVLADLERRRKISGITDTCSSLPAGWMPKQ